MWQTQSARLLGPLLAIASALAACGGEDAGAATSGGETATGLGEAEAEKLKTEIAEATSLVPMVFATNRFLP